LFPYIKACCHKPVPITDEDADMLRGVAEDLRTLKRLLAGGLTLVHHFINSI